MYLYLNLNLNLKLDLRVMSRDVAVVEIFGYIFGYMHACMYVCIYRVILFSQYCIDTYMHACMHTRQISVKVQSTQQTRKQHILAISKTSSKPEYYTHARNTAQDSIFITRSVRTYVPLPSQRTQHADVNSKYQPSKQFQPL